MLLRDIQLWINSHQNFNEGLELYRSCKEYHNPSLLQQFETWTRSSFLERRLETELNRVLEAIKSDSSKDETLSKLMNEARVIHEQHKKLYYTIQEKKRISNTKRLHLAISLLELSEKKRFAWDRLDHYKNTGEILPDKKETDLDIDLNSALAIHEKIMAKTQSILRHKNNPEKAALVNKHIETKEFLINELKQFRRN